MTCPICKRPTQHAHRPFCSQRCADRDLGKWLSGHYALPSNDPEDLEQAIEATVEARRAGDDKLH